MSSNSEDCYAILGVDPRADAKTIRKAYLKQSLKYHPDKNVDDPETAKREFVRIGEAYEVLSDPTQRAAYDRCRRSSHPFRPASHDNTTSYSTNDDSSDYYAATGSSSSSSYSQQQERKYRSYREAFDATMAGLSEDELRDVMGAAALIGSIVGGLMGSRMIGKHSNNPLVRTVGSMIGSQVASRAATTMVASAHQQSTERAALDQERRERVARGEAVPDDDDKVSKSQAWKDLASAVHQTAKMFQKAGVEASRQNNRHAA